MISVTKLLGGPSYFGDRLRYDSSSSKQQHGTNTGSGPVVVWNSTKTCNLECVHCYASAKKSNTCSGGSGASSPANSRAIVFQAISGRP